MAKKLNEEDLNKATGGVIQPVVQPVVGDIEQDNFRCKTCGHTFVLMGGEARVCTKCGSVNVEKISLINK